jgi:hypothetical protein
MSAAMMAFDHVFLEVARTEGRAIQVTDRAGKSATFLFREFYCTDPGCDCQRVVLHVHWVEEKRVAASINYGFRPSRRRDEPQISLDPLNPQSERSEELLRMFSELLVKDGGYRKTLRRHYTMWKQVVDDPTHPDHAKLRGEAHGDPSFRPAFPRRKPRSAGPRAAGAGAPAGSRSLELVAAKGAHADSKLQQRFRRLRDGALPRFEREVDAAAVGCARVGPACIPDSEAGQSRLPRQSGLQPSDDVDGHVVFASGVDRAELTEQRQRRPIVGWADVQSAKAVRHDAHDHVRQSVDQHAAPDNGRVVRQQSRPRPVAEDDDGPGRESFVVAGLQRAANLCADTQHLKEVARDECAAHHPAVDAAVDLDVAGHYARPDVFQLTVNEACTDAQFKK